MSNFSARRPTITDLMWEDRDELLSLFKTTLAFRPCHEFSHGNMFEPRATTAHELSGGITRMQWDCILSYARRIRNLSLSSRSLSKLHSSSLSTLVSWFSEPRCITPNIRRLYLEVDHRYLPLYRRLLGPQLSSLSFHLSGANSWETLVWPLLLETRRQKARLVHLHLSAAEVQQESGALPSPDHLLPNLPYLRSLSWPTLGERSMVLLSGMRHLQELRITQQRKITGPEPSRSPHVGLRLTNLVISTQVGTLGRRLEDGLLTFRSIFGFIRPSSPLRTLVFDMVVSVGAPAAFWSEAQSNPMLWSSITDALQSLTKPECLETIQIRVVTGGYKRMINTGHDLGLDVLFGFRNIVECDLSLPSLVVNSVLVAEIAQAWPKLERLTVLGPQRSNIPLPISDLLPLARYCPRLVFVCIRVYAETGDKAIWDGHSTHRVPIQLDVHDSPCGTNIKTPAAILMNLFPRLQNITTSKDGRGVDREFWRSVFVDYCCLDFRRTWAGRNQKT